MAPGQVARRVLGKKFQPFGEIYRGIFVNIDRIAQFLSEHIPAGARCLDIGGGDGIFVNAVLSRRADIHYTMTDIAPRIGSFLEPRFSDRVELHPRTAAIALLALDRTFDVITITDVVHHVPAAARAGFWADIATVCRQTKCGSIIVKDVKPRTVRGSLSLLSDWYVTGDRQVSLIEPDRMISDIQAQFDQTSILCRRHEPDAGAYCITVKLT